MSSDEKFESLEYETPRKPGVYVISKPRLYALTFATLILILMVGILSGVLAAKSAREEVKKDYEAKTDKQVGESTIPPSREPTRPTDEPTPCPTFGPVTTKKVTTKEKATEKKTTNKKSSEGPATTALPTTGPKSTTKAPTNAPTKAPTNATTKAQPTQPPTSVTNASTVATKPPTTNPPKCEELWCKPRLPTNIRPYHYNLHIKADVAGLKFNGTQEAFINVTSKTKYILFHIKSVKITGDPKLSKIDSLDTEIPLQRHFPYEEYEYHVVETKSDIAPGKYRLSLPYGGNVSIKLTGFYKSSYKENGNDEVLLTTKFQPTDARKAFPCFDEPDLKATFNVTMTYPKTHMTRSNMPMAPGGLKTNGDMETITFEKTVPMSSYLICFIVSKFEAQYTGQAGIDKNVNITIWSRPDQVANTKYAYDASIKMLTFLEEFTSVRYPMPKLDMYAIPDYGSGATEHWGIITYRESRLLWEQGVSSESNKQSSATIIAHECAHLWFGNLVTCEWWNDLWVQEGMASYLEYYAVDAMHSDWEMFDLFLTVDWKTGMSLDALASSHPISQPVTHTNQIKEIFDSITYNKGSSLLQMLDFFLGNDLFKRGIKEYLDTHKYKGATATHLWEAFSKVSGKDIKGMMETWTHQMGHPIIMMKRIDNTTFEVTQKHFLLDPDANVTQPSKYNYTWNIPFVYAESGHLTDNIKTTLTSRTSNVSVASNNWVFGNRQHKGFYRVNYDLANWQEISKNLNNNSTILRNGLFPVTDRAGTVDDVLNLARAGYVTYDLALDLIKFLETEDNYFVWKMALKNFAYLDKELSAQNAYGMFRKYMVKILKPMIQKLGIDVESTTDHIAKYNQLQFINAACHYGDQDTLSKISKMFKDWMINDKAIPADLRSTVYYYGVASGSDDEWDFVFKKYSESSNPSEKGKLQSALSASEKPWILRKWLAYALDPSIVRTQDTVYVVRAVAGSNPVGRYVAWDFVRANWLQLMEIAKANNFHVNVITSGITTQFTTKFDLEQVEEMWQRYPDALTGARAREQGIEKIKASIKWGTKYYKTVEKWFKDNS